MQRRLLAYLWFLSWFELYLEIFRHHHVTATLLADPASWFVWSTGDAHPGDWLRAVLAAATLAPIVYVIVAVSQRSRRADATHMPVRTVSEPFALASAVTWYGCLLVVLASINQFIRHEPLAVDLTLRHGNTGFILVGASLAIAGLILRRDRHRFRLGLQ